MLQWLYSYVANVCHQYFICFFQMYVASVFIWKLDMFQHICCKYFIWMLRTCCKGFQVFSCVFLQVFQTHVLFVFRRMLQMLYLDVSKVDWVFESPSLVLVINDTKLLMLCDQM
jgi:hypothetical protein